MSRKHAWFSVQVLVTLGLIYLLFRDFDWGRFCSLLRNTSIGLYGFSFAVVLSGQILYTFRWHLVLRAMGVQVAFRQLTEQYLIGMFFSNFLPTTIGGDWSRIYYLGRQRGFVSIGASVFMDRFLGFFSLTLLGTLLAWLIAPSSAPFILARNVLTVLRRFS
jgi:uncharacterized protein (TIRG00374 family)